MGEGRRKTGLETIKISFKASYKTMVVCKRSHNESVLPRSQSKAVSQNISSNANMRDLKVLIRAKCKWFDKNDL